MVSAPLFVLVLYVTVVCVKAKAAGGGSVALGVLLGLSLASTSLGAPIQQALTSMSSALIAAVSSLGGAQ